MRPPAIPMAMSPRRSAKTWRRTTARPRTAYFAKAWTLLWADTSLDRPSEERLLQLQRLGHLVLPGGDNRGKSSTAQGKETR